MYRSRLSLTDDIQIGAVAEEGFKYAGMSPDMILKVQLLLLVIHHPATLYVLIFGWKHSLCCASYIAC